MSSALQRKNTGEKKLKEKTNVRVIERVNEKYDLRENK